MDVIGFPNYKIAEDGTITNKKTGKVMTHHINNKLNGYKIVVLRINKTSKTQLVHRLLALHFIPNPENKPDVDHIDRNKLNNALSNLRWVNIEL